VSKATATEITIADLPIWGHSAESLPLPIDEDSHPSVCSYGVGVKIDVRCVNDAPVAAGDCLRAKKNRVKKLSAPGERSLC
jgi:hypothetical protein